MILTAIHTSPGAVGAHSFHQRDRATLERRAISFAKKSIDNSRMPGDRDSSFCNGGVFLFWRSWRERTKERKTPRTTDASALNSFLPPPPIFSISGRKCYFSATPRHAEQRGAFSLARAKYTKRHPFRAHASVMLFPPFFFLPSPGEVGAQSND